MLKSRFLPAMILALAMSAQAAHADDAKADNADPAKEKKMCKTEKMTGSRTRVTRVCMTAAEWDKLAADTRNRMDNYIGQSQRPDRVAQNSQLDPNFGGP